MKHCDIGFALNYLQGALGLQDKLEFPATMQNQNKSFFIYLLQETF